MVLNLIKRIFRSFHPSQIPTERGDRIWVAWGETSSGEIVSEEAALRYSAVFSCIRVLAESIAQLPLKVYERFGDDSRQVAKDFYLYPLLSLQPNAYTTAFHFWEFMGMSMAAWGNAYALIDRSYDGRVFALRQLRPDRVFIRKTSAGKIVYDVTDDQGRPGTYLFDEILHIPGMGFDGIQGYSPIRLAAETIGLGISATKYAGGFFKNGATPGGVLEHPGKLSEDSAKRLRKNWSDIYGRVDNAHKTAILEEGMKFHAMSINPEDAQLIETRKMNRTEICGIFRIPPHMIGDLDKATFCLPADVEVLSETGPKSIANIKAGEKVWSWDGNTMVLAKVKKSVCSGVDEILTIRTTTRTLRANKAHRVLALRKTKALKTRCGCCQRVRWMCEYVPAGELKVGDTIVTFNSLLPSYGGEQCPTRKVSEGLMEFCGLLLGDGPVSRRAGVTLAKAGKAIYMDYCRNVMREESRSFDKSENGRTGAGLVAFAVYLEGVDRQTGGPSLMTAEELEKLGFSGDARTKKVPGWVFGLASTYRLAFLRGCLDSCGSVDKRGRISYYSVNRERLSQIRHLCMTVGVPVTNLCERRITTHLPNDSRFDGMIYEFTCPDPGANKRIRSHDEKYRCRVNEGQLFSRKGRKYPRYGGVNRESTECGLARISEISIDLPEPVYDLEVAELHTFVANGVIVHNSNIEHQGIEFVKFTLSPWLKRIEQSLNVRLMSEKEQKRYFAEFKVDGLMRGDVKSRNEAHSLAIRNGWKSINEVRKEENLPPIVGGDRHFLQMQMVPVESGGQGGESSSGKRNQNNV